MVATRNDLRDKILSALQELPDEALAEVVQFVEYQRYKVDRQETPYDTPYRPVALGGLWQGITITDEDIEAVRREMWHDFGERDI